ncbi:hypothetical protein [Azospirillum sp. TSO35-2]|uniref:hypothetical protein n=1 Tax=Azospirillum sp. TSO35-2 TaxID=716796 RepID=UPI0011B38179|nr:hypothetical protein [Azospirillum sp. TSO35-2]
MPTRRWSGFLQAHAHSGLCSGKTATPGSMVFSWKIPSAISAVFGNGGTNGAHDPNIGPFVLASSRIVAGLF